MNLFMNLVALSGSSSFTSEMKFFIISIILALNSFSISYYFNKNSFFIDYNSESNIGLSSLAFLYKKLKISLKN